MDWRPYQNTWRCKGAESGTPFEVAELEDWTDYDGASGSWLCETDSATNLHTEKAGQGVSIMEVKTRVGRA